MGCWVLWERARCHQTTPVPARAGWPLLSSPQLTPPPPRWAPAHLWPPGLRHLLHHVCSRQTPAEEPRQGSVTGSSPPPPRAPQPLTHVSQQPTPMGCRQVQSRQLVLSHDSPRENCFPSYSQGAAKRTAMSTRGLAPGHEGDSLAPLCPRRGGTGLVVTSHPPHGIGDDWWPLHHPAGMGYPGVCQG